MKQKINNEIKLTIIISFICTCLIKILKLWKESYNINVILPFVIGLMGFIIIVLYLKKKNNKKAYLFLIPLTLIFLSNFIVKIDLTNQILNVPIIIILISIFIFSYLDKNYAINRHLINCMLNLFPRKFCSNLKELNIFKIKKVNISKLTNIIIGCAIGLPIALVILFLLTSADFYFNVFIEKILSSINNIQDWDIITHLYEFVGYFIVLFVIYRNAFKNPTKIEHEKENEKEIDTAIIKTILIIINSVFALFIFSEISKLTTNFLALPQEYTYAKYAREGFFQLLFVTLINFSIIFYNLYFQKSSIKNKEIKNLLLALILFTIILIFNSYYRMFLYINEYHFTILRLQVIIFLFMELIISIILIGKLLFKLKVKENTLFPIILISTYILNLYLCTEVFTIFLNSL